MKPYLLEDLKLDGFNPKQDINDRAVIITRENFGCGSSREHAPWALEVNGINSVFAVNYARIFRQNMYNCGMIAAELPKDVIDGLFVKFAGKETVATIDTKTSTLELKSGNITEKLNFNLTGFDRELVEAGGWVDYADKKY